MKIREQLEKVESSPLFIKWKSRNNGSYLAHIFDDENSLQFGYYNPDDTITTFSLADSKITADKGQQIFKSGKDALPALDVAGITIEFEESIRAARGVQAQRYPNHPVMRLFSILQVINGKAVYNITLVTKTFNALHIHIDARTGEVLEEKLISLMDIADIQKKKPDYIG